MPSTTVLRLVFGTILVSRLALGEPTSAILTRRNA